ncbi:DUF6976 family protein [Desulfogranum japonicum]|uniref:DUF6976 family protein n=1 Tax=Desulfogranum japonicum TaxID=231447 RepID=UPI00041B4F62|nr:hypothetical protein [Desulfogranum japonicum]
MSDILSPQLYSVEETIAAIEKGKILFLSGDEHVLKQLPKGRWIGGTSPYFMTPEGGKTSRDMIFIHELDQSHVEKVQIKLYNTSTIHHITRDAPENGFTLLLIPALTDILLQYAQRAPEYEDMFIKPVIGWVAGIHPDDIHQTVPKIFNGGTGENFSDQAVVMHVTLNENTAATIGIINIQEQGEGDTFTFRETGFSCKTVLVNGIEQNFANYLAEKQINIQQPLVADYSGASINVSFQGIDTQSQTVSFYAPVFSGVEYKLAKPVDDYISAFSRALPEMENTVIFSCNCLLNYLYSDLEGKQIAPMFGPITFGEIAYQLLNQTLVYLAIEEF